MIVRSIQLINHEHMLVLACAEQEFNRCVDFSFGWEEIHSECSAKLDSEHKKSPYKAPMKFIDDFSPARIGTLSKRFSEDVISIEVSRKTDSDEANDTTKENMGTVSRRVFFAKTMHLRDCLLSADSKLRAWVRRINGIATSDESRTKQNGRMNHV